MPRPPFWVFSLARSFFVWVFFFFFFFFSYWNYIGCTQLYYFFGSFNLIDFHLSWMNLHFSLITSYPFQCTFIFLDLTKHTFLMKCILLFFFSSPSSIWLNFFLMNLHFCSSFSTWMIFHGISCLLCLLMNQYSLATWWKFLHSFLSLFFFFFWLKSFLAWWPTLFSHSLMLFQNLISPWWVFFLSSLMEWTIPFFDELSILNLMNSSSVSLSSLRTLWCGAKTIRSTLPHLEI